MTTRKKKINRYIGANCKNLQRKINGQFDASLMCFYEKHREEKKPKQLL